MGCSDTNAIEGNVCQSRDVSGRSDWHFSVKLRFATEFPPSLSSVTVLECQWPSLLSNL